MKTALFYLITAGLLVAISPSTLAVSKGPITFACTTTNAGQISYGALQANTGVDGSPTTVTCPTSVSMRVDRNSTLLLTHGYITDGHTQASKAICFDNADTVWIINGQTATCSNG